MRIEENDSWVKYLGYWEWAPDHFRSQGRAVRAAQANSKAMVETHCSGTHDVYLGTRLDFDCGMIEARLDGGAPVQVDCYEPAARARQVRRKIFSNVPPGNHSVEIRLTGTKNTGAKASITSSIERISRFSQIYPELWQVNAGVERPQRILTP